MQPLLSIGQLCDAGCNATFTATTITISHNNVIVLQGHHTPAPKLWELDVRQLLTLHANTTIGSATATDLVTFAHAALFSLALSTLEAALWQGHVPELAGLTLQSLRKHPPISEATIKGHLDQTWQNLHSTKRSPLPIIRHN